MRCIPAAKSSTITVADRKRLRHERLRRVRQRRQPVQCSSSNRVVHRFGSLCLSSTSCRFYSEIKRNLPFSCGCDPLRACGIPSWTNQVCHSRAATLVSFQCLGGPLLEFEPSTFHLNYHFSPIWHFDSLCCQLKSQATESSSMIIIRQLQSRPSS